MSTRLGCSTTRSLQNIAELAAAHHVAAFAAKRQCFETVSPEAILAERNKIEKQALEILNAERHKLRETLSAEYSALQQNAEAQSREMREEGMKQIQSLSDRVAQLSAAENAASRQSARVTQALAESQQKELLAAAAARDAMKQLDTEKAASAKVAALARSLPSAPPAPTQYFRLDVPVARPGMPTNNVSAQPNVAAAATTTATRASPVGPSDRGNPARSPSPPGGGRDAGKPPPSPGGRGGPSRGSPSSGGSPGGRGDGGTPAKGKSKKPPDDDPGDDDEDDSGSSSSSSFFDEDKYRRAKAREKHYRRLLRAATEVRAKEADH